MLMSVEAIQQKVLAIAKRDGNEAALEASRVAHRGMRQAEAEIAGRIRVLIPELTELNDHPDGSGFYYGHVGSGSDYVSVNVLPPVEFFGGDFPLGSFAPHETDWIVYFEDKEVARGPDLQALQVPTVKSALSKGWFGL